MCGHTLTWMTIFEWYMTRFLIEDGHTQKHIHYNESRLCAKKYGQCCKFNCRESSLWEGLYNYLENELIIGNKENLHFDLP